MTSAQDHPAQDHPAHRGVFWPHLGAAAFIILWLDVGVGSSLTTSFPAGLKVGVLGLWLVVAAARSTTFLAALIANGWPLVLMLFISVAYAPEVAQAGQYTQGFAYLLIAFALYCFYSLPEYRRERHLLLGVMVVDLVVTAVRTFLALQSDPLLSRYLATTEENRLEIYGNQSFAGLGGFGFAYSLGAIVLVLLYYAVRPSRVRIPLLVAVVAGSVMLFEMAFATAILLVLTLAALFLMHDLVTRREFRLFGYAAVLLGWIVGLYSTILDGIAGRDWVTEDVSGRLTELSGFLSGESPTGGDLSTRTEYWRQSLQAFWSGGPFGLAGGEPRAQDAGGHSQWFDMLASYGLFTLIPFTFFLLAWRLGRGRAGAEIVAVRRAWIYFVLLGFVNNVLYSTIVLTWMFFIPALAGWLESQVAGQRARSRERVAA